MVFQKFGVEMGCDKFSLEHDLDGSIIIIVIIMCTA